MSDCITTLAFIALKGLFDLGRRRRLHGLVLLALHLGITAPRLESTVAALALNKLAQDTFEKHIYADMPRENR